MLSLAWLAVEKCRACLCWRNERKPAEYVATAMHIFVRMRHVGFQTYVHSCLLNYARIHSTAAVQLASNKAAL